MLLGPMCTRFLWVFQYLHYVHQPRLPNPAANAFKIQTDTNSSPLFVFWYPTKCHKCIQRNAAYFPSCALFVVLSILYPMLQKKKLMNVTWETKRSSYECLSHCINQQR